MIFGTKTLSPKNQAECLHFCCRFLSCHDEASPTLIDKISSNQFTGKKTDHVHEICLSFNDTFELYHKIPFLIEQFDVDYFGLKVDQLNNEYINLEVNEQAYLKFLKLFNKIASVHGAIITGNEIAIALRKKRGFFEFFDPTGEEAINCHSGYPYIHLATTEEEAAAYMIKRFPEGPEGGIEDAPLNVWPIHYRKA